LNSSSSSSVIAEVTHEVQRDVLCIRLAGRAGVNVLMDHVMAHLDEWVAHDRLIYDLREWNVDSLTTESFRDLPRSFAPVHAQRKTGKAAILIAPHLEELAKILLALYEAENLPVQLAYFFEREPAETWLAEPVV